MAARFQFPLKRSPKSDPQQYKVYRMENEAIGARSYQRLDRKYILRLARSVCRNYRVPQARVKWTRLLGVWAAEWDDGVIKLNTRKNTARDMLTITHELAHHVHWHLSDKTDRHESHGPEFMAVHMSILDTCRLIPIVGMRAICAAWDVKFTDPGTTNSLQKLKRICRS